MFGCRALVSGVIIFGLISSAATATSAEYFYISDALRALVEGENSFPAIKASVKRVEAAHNQATAALLRVASFNVAYSRRNGTQQYGAGDSIGHSSSEYNSTFQLDPERLFGYFSAKNAIRLLGDRLEDLKLDLSLELIRFYHGYYMAQASIQVVESNQILFRALIDRANSTIANPEKRRQAIAQLERAIQKRDSQLINLQNARNSARIGIHKLLNLNPPQEESIARGWSREQVPPQKVRREGMSAGSNGNGTDIVVDSIKKLKDIVDDMYSIPATFEDAIVMAELHNPSLSRARHEVAGTKIDQNREKFGWMIPSVGVGTGREEGEQKGFEYEGESTGVSVNWHVSFGLYHDMKAADKQVRAAEFDSDALAREIAASIELSYQDFNSAREKYDQELRNLQWAIARVEEIDDIDLATNVQDAIAIGDALFDSSLSSNQAMLQLMTVKATILTLTGTLLDDLDALKAVELRYQELFQQ